MFYLEFRYLDVPSSPMHVPQASNHRVHVEFFPSRACLCAEGCSSIDRMPINVSQVLHIGFLYAFVVSMPSMQERLVQNTFMTLEYVWVSSSTRTQCGSSRQIWCSVGRYVKAFVCLTIGSGSSILMFMSYYGSICGLALLV